jgi:drug/metabolite transporter (DMT)-like permease
VTILLAMVLLRERLNRVQVGGVVFSLGALWLFNIEEGSGFFSSTVMFAVLPVVFWGLSGFLQKVATNHLAAEVAALVYLLAFVPVAFYLAARHAAPEVVELRTCLLVVALGFFLAFGNYAFLAACARGGKAAVVAPLGSLYPLVSVPIAVLFLGEQLGWREVGEIALALLSVTALSWEGRGPAPASLGKRPSTRRAERAP